MRSWRFASRRRFGPGGGRDRGSRADRTSLAEVGDPRSRMLSARLGAVGARLLVRACGGAQTLVVAQSRASRSRRRSWPCVAHSRASLIVLRGLGALAQRRSSVAQPGKRTGNVASSALGGPHSAARARWPRPDGASAAAQLLDAWASASPHVAEALRTPRIGHSRCPTTAQVGDGCRCLAPPFAGPSLLLARTRRH